MTVVFIITERAAMQRCRALDCGGQPLPAPNSMFGRFGLSAAFYWRTKWLDVSLLLPKSRNC